MVNSRAFLALLALLFLAGPLTPIASPDSDQSSGPLLILYAFKAEGQLLADSMSITGEQRLLGRRVYTGTLAGHDIFLAESGIGMTNAAMTAQKLIDQFAPRAVLFTGIAGAIDTSVEIGDIVICSDWITHDFGYHGSEGFQPGPIRVFDPASDSIKPRTSYRIDSGFFEIAASLPEQGLQLDTIAGRAPRIHIGGTGVSGNAFIDNVEKRLWLRERFLALVTDMESASVAQVCEVNNLPFIVFRSASDLAGGSGSDSATDELERFFEIAARNSSTILLHFLRKL